MKARITFVHDPEDAFDPAQLQIQNETLHVNNLKAAREVRITLGLQELPQEVRIIYTHNVGRNSTFLYRFGGP
jgi:hypothetical protein